MARQTPRKKLTLLTTQYYERYVRFSEQLHNSWMYFEVQSEFLHLIESRNQDIEYQSSIRLQSLSPVNPDTRAPSRLRGENLAGFILRTHRKETPETVLLNSVSLFESFVSDIAGVAYLAFPKRFLLRSKNGKEVASDKENAKLLKILIESSNREEAIERYIEEKLRGIFYGNPVDVFKKNSLGFNLDKSIGNDCVADLTVYAEIAARRNVIVHNLGKIDQKYIREIDNAAFTVGDKVNISRDYLFQALRTINNLAKKYVTEVSLATTGERLPSVRMGVTKKATKAIEGT